jgi:glycine/D-amino acid oxidase-like deaminating enzyme
MLTTRRRLLRLGGAAAALALAGRCASRGTSSAQARTARPRLEPVDVDPNRIIRRVVGLRPFRPSGFVVRAEPLGDKLLVHNYGHGGAGVTLSWGTGELAADLVRDSGRRGSAAVIGCGAVGLAAARILQDRGYDVTIYARDLPPDTTSNVAGAMWYPSMVADRSYRTPEFDAQFTRAQKLSHLRFQGLVGADYAVTWRPLYVLSQDPDSTGLPDLGLPELYPGRRVLTPAERPFDAPGVVLENLLFIEPPTYLRALLRDFRLAGGRVVVRAFEWSDELATLPESVVVNCTGLGSRDLFGDTEMIPIKGQLTVLLPQTEIGYAMEASRASSVLYMFPRSDGILLGGTFERDVWTLEPDMEAERRILEGQRAIFAEMKGA